MLTIFDVLLSLAVSFTITFLSIPVIITVADRKKLFDHPDERKIHETPIPALGGLGIFAGLVMAVLLALKFQQAAEFQFFLAAAFVIFFLGLKDDILILSPVKKLIGQIMAAFLIIYQGGMQIHSMHGFMGLTAQLPELFSLLLTYFTVLVIINSFNLIDGVDGLAGTLGFIAALFFGSYFIVADIIPYAVLAFALAGSIGAFLIFNVQPAKIFMGDTGSLLIGLIQSILVVKFISAAENPLSSSALNAAPAIGFAALMIPLMDTLRVFAIRIFHRRSPFSPDRNHVHHLFLDLGFSHKKVTLTLASVNVCFLLFVFIFRDFGTTLLLFFTAIAFFSLIGILYYLKPKPTMFVAKKTDHNSITKRVVSLTDDTILEQKN